MRARAVSRWREALNGFWLVPGGTAVLVAALAFVAVAVDRSIDARSPLGFDGDASAARDLLGVIAASLITVAGLAFSITMVTLQLVSSQYSPRALRRLLADRHNQLVVGLLVGVFGYCVIVMRTVTEGSAGGEAFVPGVAVTTAIVLAFVGLAALVWFIHHVGQIVQVSEILGSVGRRALARVEEVAADGEAEDAEALVDSWHAEGTPSRARPGRAGFVQSVDVGALLREVAGDVEVRVNVVARPGDFVTQGDVVVETWPAGLVTADIAAAAIIVADERDGTQDPGYPVRILSDVALKALSPGINDPTTARTAIGHLRAALERAAALPGPVRVTRDAEGRSVVVHARRSFEDLLEEGVAELSRTVGTYAFDALLHLLDTVEREALAGPVPSRADAIPPYRAAIAAARAAA